MSEERRRVLMAAVSRGGSGLTVVASGEFQGASDAGRQTISLGNKMAVTDFYMLIKAKEDSEFERNGYSFIVLTALCMNCFGRYTLTNNGTCVFTPCLPVFDDNSGTLTEKSAGKLMKDAQVINSGNIRDVTFNTFTLSRDNTNRCFNLYFGHSNVLYNLPSDITYEYEIVYFGSNPSEDIVSIM